jgi:hypothetical protein
MNIRTLIEESVGDELKDGLLPYFNVGVFPQEREINELITLLSQEQIDILRAKFKNVNNFSQFRDILAEVQVARKYIHEEPEFCSGEGEPDIFLRATSRYVEVKRINPSDEDKDFEDKVHQMHSIGEAHITNAIMLGHDDLHKGIKPIFKKARDLIDKGNTQLNGRQGFTYLFYSLDSTPYYIRDNSNISSLRKEIESLLLKHINDYANEQNIEVVCEEYAL